MSLTAESYGVCYFMVTFAASRLITGLLNVHRLAYGSDSGKKRTNSTLLAPSSANAAPSRNSTKDHCISSEKLLISPEKILLEWDVGAGQFSSMSRPVVFVDRCQHQVNRARSAFYLLILFPLCHCDYLMFSYTGRFMALLLGDWLIHARAF